MSTQNKIRDLQTDYCKFEIYLVEPEINDKFKIPYVLAIPEKIDENSKLILKTNEKEKDVENNPINYTTKRGKELLIEDAINKVIGEIEYIKKLKTPIAMPVIPYNIDHPYYQQLSRECFEINDSNSEFYRIDEQVYKIIEDSKK